MLLLRLLGELDGVRRGDGDQQPGGATWRVGEPTRWLHEVSIQMQVGVVGRWTVSVSFCLAILFITFNVANL